METIIGKNYTRQVIPLIENAQKSIRVVVFDWRWYENDIGNPCQLFNNSIVRARKRGVEVQACVNSDSIAKPLRENNIDVKIPVSKSLMHVKMLIIDDQTVVLGSHNFSLSAFTQNLELSVILKNTPNIADFILFFQSLWQL